LASDLNLFNNYFLGMLNQGIYLPPSQFEANFITIQHTLEDTENTLIAMENVFKNLSSGKFYI